MSVVTVDEKPRLIVQPCFHSRESIETFSRSIAQRLNYSPGTSLTSVVRRLNGQIHYVAGQELARVLDRSLHVRGPADFDIYVEADALPWFAHYRIAHELGHYFLHYPDCDSSEMVAPRYSKGLAETEADWFADEFLMPSDLIKDEIRNPDMSIFQLSDKFGVSTRKLQDRMRHVETAA